MTKVKCQYKWIKCTEQNPPNNQDVLCAAAVALPFSSITTRKIIVAHYHVNFWVSHSLFVFITHWMPLPEPPEDE